jgi:hypothetical protein
MVSLEIPAKLKSVEHPLSRLEAVELRTVAEHGALEQTVDRYESNAGRIEPLVVRTEMYCKLFSHDFWSSMDLLGRRASARRQVYRGEVELARVTRVA